MAMRLGGAGFRKAPARRPGPGGPARAARRRGGRKVNRPDARPDPGLPHRALVAENDLARLQKDCFAVIVEIGSRPQLVR